MQLRRAPAGFEFHQKKKSATDGSHDVFALVGMVQKFLHDLMKVKSALRLLCCFVTPAISTLHAQEAKLPWPNPTQVIRLWPGAAPGLVDPQKKEEIFNERIRNVSVPELWLYLPPGGIKKRKSIVICPGGGYVHHAMGLHVGNVVKLFHQNDVVVFGLKYRTRYGANDVAADAVADCERAIRLIRHRAVEWGIDQIAVQGYSAGGNIGLNLLGCWDAGNADAEDAIERQSSRPDLVALMCPWPNGRTIAHYKILANPPPVFVASAADDKTAPQRFAHDIATEVRKQNGKVREFDVPTGGHAAFHYGVSEGPGAQWPDPLFEMWKSL